jgi:hypothetical protein
MDQSVRGFDCGGVGAQSLNRRLRAVTVFCWIVFAGSAGFLVLLVSALVVLTASVHRDAHSPRALAPPSKARRKAPADARPAGKPSDLFEARELLDDAGFAMATLFTGSIHHPESLAELREAVRLRGRIGLGVLQAELDHVLSAPRTPRQRGVETARILFQIGLLHLYDGQFADASATLEEALGLERLGSLTPRVRAELLALLGIIALSQAELNQKRASLVPSGEIVPSARAVAGAEDALKRKAIAQLTASLRLVDDLHVRWLLNVAYMRLGEYPEKVPSEYLISLDRLGSGSGIGRFDDVAGESGLLGYGPSTAGACVFDDFSGDGIPDLFTTSLDAERGAALQVNRGDGTFAHASAAAGLGDQVYALAAAAADFDNDGKLDVVLLRGAGESPLRLSLLRNKGDLTFEDVTVRSGLSQPISSGSAAWGDYDNDGWVDLFVCGEYGAANGSGASQPDPRNRCRLYHNRRDGTFVDVAARAGVVNECTAKGAAWGDHDGDGRLDLFVSNFDGPCRLYRNQGDGAFRDVADGVGVAGPDHYCSSSCWFWDFDNDGRLDLFVNDYSPAPSQVAAYFLGGQSADADAGHPRLYRNLGTAGFRDVSAEAGLERPIPAVSANFGDINNDGYLDVYFATGWDSYSGLTPSLMLKNVAGRRLQDVTASTATGYLKRARGISFADWDGDGDLDLFGRTGGLVPGDRSVDLLLRNPGRDSHWLKVKLVGTQTNRSALGARIRADLALAAGRTRSIYRTVGNNSSSGGNWLVEMIGLGDAPVAAKLTITWPTSRTGQTFHDVVADQAVEITEGVANYRVIERPRG